jgi:hypothetical protein
MVGRKVFENCPKPREAQQAYALFDDLVKDFRVFFLMALIGFNLRDRCCVSHGYSPFLTSAGVIALGSFVSPARRVYDST